MRKEKILEILENAKDGNGAVPMRLVRTAFDKLPEPCEDTISRQAAIDAVNNAFDRETLLTGFVRSIAVRAIRDMPSAQPEERTEKHTETHASVLIRQQDAVELAMKYCPDDDGTVQCDGDIRELLDELENLPPAQPESEHTMEEFMYGQDMGNPEDGSL